MTGETSQDALYAEAAAQFGAAIVRVVRGYEADPEKRLDLNQEIHLQLWRSFASFDARCSLRTWVYRVAHHVAASHVLRERRKLSGLLSLEELEQRPDPDPVGMEAATDRRRNLDRLERLIQQLKPLDRQVIIAYLEDMDAASIAEITGLTPASVAMRIHRIKNILTSRFHRRR